MIDASAFQLLLTFLTRWLDRQEREVLRSLSEENCVLRRQLRGDLASRRVHILGSTPHPHELLMRQVGRTLTTADDGLLRAHRVLICDRDAKWSGEVRRPLSDGGIRVVQTPFHVPNANAHAERFVRGVHDSVAS